MFDDGERKVNKITSRGQNVDRINIVLAFNVCQSRAAREKEQFQVSVVFARNASRGFSLNRRMRHETTQSQRIVADVNACECKQSQLQFQSHSFLSRNFQLVSVGSHPRDILNNSTRENGTKRLRSHY